MNDLTILRLGINTKKEYLNDPFRYIKKSYNKIYLDENECIGFDKNNIYIDYIPIYQKFNIIVNFDSCYKKINEIFNSLNDNRNKFILNYGYLGENITFAGINYLDLIIGEKLIYKNVILEIIDFVKPDHRLNIFPLQENWWKQNFLESEYLFQLKDLINFPGICGFYVKVIESGFIFY